VFFLLRRRDLQSGCSIFRDKVMEGAPIVVVVVWSYPCTPPRAVHIHASPPSLLTSPPLPSTTLYHSRLTAAARKSASDSADARTTSCAPTGEGSRPSSSGHRLQAIGRLYISFCFLGRMLLCRSSVFPPLACVYPI
jgi:hypothetical protein